MSAKQDPAAGFTNGILHLFDGTRPQWLSDGEEQFLNQLKVCPDDSYLWNRLGNLYYKGGRPELAAAVLEHSIAIDPSQVESHYTLADLLNQIGEVELAARHFRQTLVYASTYSRMDALKLRFFLADSLCTLMDYHHASEGRVPYVPTHEELAVKRQIDDSAAAVERELPLYEFQLKPGDRDSFLPVAEMYMGALAEGIPEQERTLHKHLRLQESNRGEERISSMEEAHDPDQGWGSKRQPIVVKVRTEERADKVARVCEKYNWHYILYLASTEDIGDLKKALRQKFEPASVYDPCPCGSEAKYRFCCANKLKNFELNRFLT